MNNNIQEDYCSFEVSKLLKEKGFGIDCLYYYDVNQKLVLRTWADISKLGKEESQEGTLVFQAPTHALAIKWIRENFQWEILVDHVGLFSFRYTIKTPGNYEHPIIENNYDSTTGITNGYPTYNEATEAALLYTLKNLI